jgi:hypothetical protein
MKAIKWIGKKQFNAIGALIPGMILTECQTSVEAMEKWVDQGQAEWFVEPTDEPMKEVIKKRVKREV